ncbi:hypothetical protein QFZ76_006771 [Streptomyces sp. V4I2]|nr:hypothetical protein [Streptomyces sp. V4I2]
MIGALACGALGRSGYGDPAIWDAGCGASVRGPCSTGVMVQGLPVASGRAHPARSRRELASRDRTTHKMRVAAPGLSTPGASAPKTVRGVLLSGLTPAQSRGTVRDGLHPPPDLVSREVSFGLGTGLPQAGGSMRREVVGRKVGRWTLPQSRTAGRGRVGGCPPAAVGASTPVPPWPTDSAPFRGRTPPGAAPTHHPTQGATPAPTHPAQAAAGITRPTPEPTQPTRTAGPAGKKWPRPTGRGHTAQNLSAEPRPPPEPPRPQPPSRPEQPARRTATESRSPRQGRRRPPTPAPQPQRSSCPR